jgi:phospholipid transport system substrate-binding protein
MLDWKRNAVRFWLALFVVTGPLGLERAPVFAEESAKQVVDKTVRDALKILRDDKLKADRKQRVQKLREVADRAFDWEGMAKSSLGAPWRNLNDTQRRDFVEVFKELLAQRYMDDIDRFQGSEELTVGNADQQAELAVVKTTLFTVSREQIPIDYTLRLTNGQWRAQDISIEGISLVNHYRKTFGRYLTNKSFDQLLAQLKQKLGGAAGGGKDL